MRMLLIVLALAMLLYVGAGNASTVTLVGSCHTSFNAGASSGAIRFTISNIGNGTASNIIAVPHIGGASTSNLSEAYGLLAPFSNHTFSFTLYNASSPGIYPEYFTIEYAQGSASVFEVFPCLGNIGANTTSLVSIIGMSRKGNKIIANIYSLSSEPLNVTLSTVAPPNIGISSSNVTVLMQPNSEYNATFNITSRNITSYGSISNESFTFSVFISYIKNNLHYSSLGVMHIQQNAPVSHPLPIFLIGITAIFIAVIALIALSLFKGKGRKRVDKEAAGKDA